MPLLSRYKFFDRTQLEHTNRTATANWWSIVIHRGCSGWGGKNQHGRTTHAVCMDALQICTVWRMFAKFPDCLKVAFIDCASWHAFKTFKVTAKSMLHAALICVIKWGYHVLFALLKRALRMTKASQLSWTWFIRNRNVATTAAWSMAHARTYQLVWKRLLDIGRHVVQWSFRYFQIHIHNNQILPVWPGFWFCNFSRPRPARPTENIWKRWN